MNQTLIISFTLRSEYGAFWKCIQAGGVYIFTQLCKMLIMATFFDSESVSAGEDFSLLTVRLNFNR